MGVWAADLGQFEVYCSRIVHGAQRANLQSLNPDGSNTGGFFALARIQRDQKMRGLPSLPGILARISHLGVSSLAFEIPYGFSQG